MIFSIHQKPIIIYGAAAYGALVFEYLTKAGVEVYCFIDRRANEIREFCNRKVYTLDSFSELDLKHKEYIVVVAIKNVFEHSSIAMEIARLGFNQIIYKPIEVINGRGTPWQYNIDNAYELIISNNVSELKEVDCIKNVGKLDEITDYATIKVVSENERIVLVPFELVFTDSKFKGMQYDDVNISMLIPHIDFFRFCSSGKDGGLSNYMDFCVSAASKVEGLKVTNSWKQNVLNNRSSICDNMTLSLDLDPEFFVRNAPYANYSKKGYFNINSGKHRTSFLFAKERMFIPLRIQNNDYNDWVGMEEKSLSSAIVIKENHINIKGPFLHPYFYNNLGKRNGFLRKTFAFISEFIARSLLGNLTKDRLRNVSCLCLVDDDGYIERCLTLAGLDVYSDYDSCEVDILTKHIDILLNCKRNEREPIDKYEYIVLDSRKNISLKNALEQSNIGVFYISDFKVDFVEFKPVLIYETLCRGNSVYLYFIERGKL